MAAEREAIESERPLHNKTSMQPGTKVRSAPT